MKQTAGERLREARIAAGYRTAAAAARALGEHPQNVADHEADRRNITPEKAEKYGRLYKVDPSHFIFGEGHTSASGVTGNDNVRMVGVIGEVRAGAFAEIPDEEPKPWEFVPVNLPEYARASLYALYVVGRSMDRYYPDGSAVVVCPTAEAGIREGDHVVVRVRKGSLAETTLKEVVVAPDGVELWPRSTDAAYQTPIRLYTLRDSDEGPEIIGVVVGSFASRAARSGPLINLDSAVATGRPRP
jgi:phage repressor protein C with HTH and peptisase S24 domain